MPQNRWDVAKQRIQEKDKETRRQNRNRNIVTESNSLSYKQREPSCIRQLSMTPNKKANSTPCLLTLSTHSCCAARKDNPTLKFELLHQLGQGSCGTVYRSVHNETNEIYAVKVIPLSKSEEESFVQIQREIKTMRNCRHPNIVQYFVWLFLLPGANSESHAMLCIKEAG